MQEVPLLTMLKNGVHFGHQKRHWHPSMKPYLYSIRGGIHVIDLEKTAAQLQVACAFLREVAGRGGQILFIATKRQAQSIARKYAESLGMPYISNRWIGGTLTNFENIMRLVKRLKDLRRQKETGELAKYTKREQTKFAEEIVELEKLVGGIENMAKLPQALFIIDIKQEKTAVREARNMKIPVVAMVDSNSNPTLVTYPIPANDDASKSIELITKTVAEAISEGLKQPAKEAKPEVQPAQKNN